MGKSRPESGDFIRHFLCLIDCLTGSYKTAFHSLHFGSFGAHTTDPYHTIFIRRFLVWHMGYYKIYKTNFYLVTTQEIIWRHVWKIWVVPNSFPYREPKKYCWQEYCPKIAKIGTLIGNQSQWITEIAILQNVWSFGFVLCLLNSVEMVPENKQN